MIENKFKEDLREIGVEKGDVLLVHASFKSLRFTHNGPQKVIELLLEYLGEHGTLLMPALTFEYVTKNNPCFHIRKTKSCVGILPETFRLTKGVIRSLHPTHSVCAQGKYAKALLENHWKDTTPCGENSPFHLLPKYEGKILMLGCGLRPNTSLHAIEELHTPDYLFAPPLEYTMVNEHGQLINKTYTIHNFHNWVQRYDRVELLDHSSWLIKGKILEATSYLIESASLWEKVSEKMMEDQHFFVDQK